jgi:hypothetical protein
MLVPASSNGLHHPEQGDCQAAPPHQPPGNQRRRGATAMEYLFVLSLIFVVAMVGINYFGQATKQKADAASGAIQKAMQGPGAPGP